MKIKSFSTTTLLAILTLGAVLPTTVLADSQLESEGTVIVEEGGKDPGSVGPTIDPENPDVTLPNPDPESPEENVNPTPAALMIEKTTDLDFGTIKTSATKVEQYAKPMLFNGGAEKRGAYIQWRDIRAGGIFGYEITAELTQQFKGKTTPTNKLSGSVLNFTNGLAVAQGDNTNIAPSNIKTGFELNEDDGAITVVTASKALSEGKGRYIMSFGQSNATPKNNEGESVQLAIPANIASNMTVDTYTAEVTWKVVAAK